MRRFYKTATVAKRNDKFVIELDGKTVKTPEKAVCFIPTKEMADIVAKEWNAQEKEIDTFSMPITKMVNTAIDRVEKRRADLIDELVNYASSDQICYRADYPDELIEQQNNLWNPLLKRIKEIYSIDLKVTTGIIHIEQSKDQLDKIRSVIEEIESFKLTAFHSMTTVTGSVTIAFNLFGRHITIDQAWEAGHLDENFQTSQWGIDAEAEERRDNLKCELKNADLFLSLC